jgi:transposase-like protein
MGKRDNAKERDRLIETVRASGEPVKVVAQRLGIRESTAYYWMKGARRGDQPKFARVLSTATISKASLSIDVEGVVIRLEAGFDAALLREVIAALKGGLK